jgi:hypothetical protein
MIRHDERVDPDRLGAPRRLGQFADGADAARAMRKLNLSDLRSRSSVRIRPS